MPGRYHFVTEMRLSSSPSAVETVLRDVTRWPVWWKWARRIEPLDSLAPGTVGARYRNHIVTPLRYGFVYDTEVVAVSERDIRLDSRGDLEGSGLFFFTSTDGAGVTLAFTWLVQTSKWWMNLVGPLARPLFTWNHHAVMTDFARGLAHATGGVLLTVRHVSVTRTDPAFFVQPDQI